MVLDGRKLPGGAIQRPLGSRDRLAARPGSTAAVRDRVTELLVAPPVSNCFVCELALEVRVLDAQERATPAEAEVVRGLVAEHLRLQVDSDHDVQPSRLDLEVGVLLQLPEALVLVW